ncbi:MAPEG family protein [Pseudoalteromonas denitrificans]|uniref:MAPEG family protein n=1 Tax=Pseudoalteromonas denitrificans TaxID=43656 RepID=UPI002481A9DC|nr:MAPEG family protein [Pseudoalteromonas denitrificans]
MENLAVFVPLVFSILYLNISSETTIFATMVYFVARTAHFFLYTFGIPYLRTVAFFIGFLVQVLLGFTILAAI